MYMLSFVAAMTIMCFKDVCDFLIHRAAVPRQKTVVNLLWTLSILLLCELYF